MTVILVNSVSVCIYICGQGRRRRNYRISLWFVYRIICFQWVPIDPSSLILPFPLGPLLESSGLIGLSGSFVNDNYSWSQMKHLLASGPIAFLFWTLLGLNPIRSSIVQNSCLYYIIQRPFAS